MIIRRSALLGVLVVSISLLAACDAPATPAAGGAPTSAPGDTVPTGSVPTAPVVGAPTPAPTEPPFVARVNGEPVLLSDYEDQVARFEAEAIAQGLDPNTPDGQAQLAQIRENVRNGMIDTLLIVQEAQRKNITVTDEEFAAEQQRILDLSGGRDAFVAYLSATGQPEDRYWVDLRVSMLANKVRDQVVADVPAVAPQVHARHILVDNVDLANSLLAQLQAGADFASLAQQYSQEVLTRAGGGDFGWFPRGTLISKEVEDAAFALQPGQFSGVVQSAFGYHIVQVIEADPARALTPDQLRQSQEAYMQRWLDSLRSAAVIEQ